MVGEYVRGQYNGGCPFGVGKARRDVHLLQDQSFESPTNEYCIIKTAAAAAAVRLWYDLIVHNIKRLDVFVTKSKPSHNKMSIAYYPTT